jgi:membrane protease YdiL (CAAX protease family)
MLTAPERMVQKQAGVSNRGSGSVKCRAMNHLDPLAVWYLFLFGLFVPYIAIQSNRKIRAGTTLPPRKTRFRNIVVMEGFFLACAWYAAWSRGIPIFARGHFSVRAVVAAVVFLAVGLGTIPIRWKHTSEADKRHMLLTRPQERSDLGPWFAVSVAAGFVEEIVYRGVMLAFLIPITRNWYVAVLLCVFFFALGHLNQGVGRAAFIGVMALAFHYFVALTGSLYLAMAVHFLYDWIAGLMYVRFAREFLPAGSSARTLTPV